MAFNFWSALDTLNAVQNPPQPMAPGTIQKVPSKAEQISQIRRQVGSLPKRAGPVGPDAIPSGGAPLKRNIAAARGSTGNPSIKKGLPTVSGTAAYIMDEYQSLSDIESLLASARLARNMKRRGFNDSSSVNVSKKKPALPVPGRAFGGVPTVNPDTSNVTTKAEISALPNLIGATPENADPRTLQALSEAKASVAKTGIQSTSCLQVGNAGEAAAVITTRTPVGPAMMSVIRQVPTKDHDAVVMQANAIANETAKMALDQVMPGRLSAFKKSRV